MGIACVLCIEMSIKIVRKQTPLYVKPILLSTDCIHMQYTFIRNIVIAQANDHCIKKNGVFLFTMCVLLLRKNHFDSLRFRSARSKLTLDFRVQTLRKNLMTFRAFELKIQKDYFTTPYQQIEFKKKVAIEYNSLLLTC